jgi:sugar-specific transcriptional regulator TrmB
MVDVFQNPLYRDLEKLNWTTNEAQVYLSLLRLGPTMAGAIAKDCPLDRSSTYNALDALVSKGIVAVVHETKRAIYVPQDPKKIVDYFEEKREIAKGVSESLEKYYKATKEKSNVLLLKGFKGLKTVFQDILDTADTGEPYYVVGTGGQFKKLMPYYSGIFRKRKEQRKLKTRRLIEGAAKKKVRGKYTEYRSVPIKIDNPATINIYGSKVAVFMWSENPEAVLIEDERVSRTLRGYFDLVWKGAKRM